MITKLTPVLFAVEVEPCAAFWVERLGFKKTTEVPEGDRLGFVILQKGDVELMYQSYASGEKDVPALAELHRRGPTFLYVQVEKLDAIESAVQGSEIAIPRRNTFYGSTELGIKDPAGHVILFAEFA